MRCVTCRVAILDPIDVVASSMLRIIITALLIAHVSAYTCASCSNGGALIRSTPCECRGCPEPFVAPDCSYTSADFLTLKFTFSPTVSLADFFPRVMAGEVKQQLFGLNPQATNIFTFSRIIKIAATKRSPASWYAVFSVSAPYVQELLLLSNRLSGTQPAGNASVAWFYKYGISDIDVLTKVPSPAFFMASTVSNPSSTTIFVGGGLIALNEGLYVFLLLPCCFVGFLALERWLMYNKAANVEAAILRNDLRGDVELDEEGTEAPQGPGEEASLQNADPEARLKSQGWRQVLCCWLPPSLTNDPLFTST